MLSAAVDDVAYSYPVALHRQGAHDGASARNTIESKVLDAQGDIPCSFSDLHTRWPMMVCRVE
jgi:hypothetical protein